MACRTKARGMLGVDKEVGPADQQGVLKFLPLRSTRKALLKSLDGLPDFSLRPIQEHADLIIKSESFFSEDGARQG